MKYLWLLLLLVCTSHCLVLHSAWSSWVSDANCKEISVAEVHSSQPANPEVSQTVLCGHGQRFRTRMVRQSALHPWVSEVVSDNCHPCSLSFASGEYSISPPQLNAILKTAIHISNPKVLVVIGGLSKPYSNEPPSEIISPEKVCGSIPPPPERIIQAQAVYMDNKLMVCGGHRSWGKRVNRKSCEIMEMSNRQWTHGPEMKVGRSQFTMTKAGQYIYALGGQSDEDGFPSIDLMEKFSVSSGEWTMMDQKLPSKRRFHCTVFMETTNSLVVMGGYMWNRQVDAYSLDTSTWTHLAPMPTELNEHGCAVFDQTIVVTGGEAGGHYYKDVYQLAGGVWKTIGQLEVPRARHTMGILDGKLLVIGGARSWTGNGRWNTEYMDSIEEMQQDGSFRLSKWKLSQNITEHAQAAIPRSKFTC